MVAAILYSCFYSLHVRWLWQTVVSMINNSYKMLHDWYYCHFANKNTENQASPVIYPKPARIVIQIEPGFSLLCLSLPQ